MRNSKIVFAKIWTNLDYDETQKPRFCKSISFLLFKILLKYNKSNNKPKNLPLPIGINLSNNLETSKIEDIQRFQQEEWCTL